jgi:DNA-binding PadR family transcriptional regulator
MPDGQPVRSSPLGVTILALLIEEPLHPYQMQVRLKFRGKDQVVNVKQRGNLYKTIDRLRDAGLVQVQTTERDQSRPERTVYEITDAGRETATEWLRKMLAVPERDYPTFPLAMSLLPMLTPDDAVVQLRLRRVRLDESIASERAGLKSAQQMGLPRLFLIESEYVIAAAVTERKWVNGVIDDLERGDLTWSAEWLASISDTFTSQEPGA